MAVRTEAETEKAATWERMEPDVRVSTGIGDDSPIIEAESLASIAISLARIADALCSPNAYGEVGSAAVAGAIVRGLRGQ